MKRILLHLPLVAGLLCAAGTLTARDEQLKTNTAKPLHFIANAGQVIDQYFHSRGDIDFKLAAGNGLNIFIGSGKIEYQWAIPKELFHDVVMEEEEVVAKEGYEMYRMDVQLIGANPKATVVAEGRQAYYERYFLSWVNQDNSNNGVIAHAYSKITYKDVYPHIDWVFYFNAKGQLEHDFMVHPGGKVSDIRIRYSGADQLQIRADGSLMALTPMGSLIEHAPIAYSNQGTSISARFRLQDNHTLSFDIASYTGTLVIDPVLEWGTYYGGAGNDECFAITADKWGFVYMAGSTASTDNIATTGAHQTTFGGGTDDAFLSKWNKSGHLLWASYYGGNTIDVAKGVGCDTSGNVYIGGQTNSIAGIATANGFQPALNGTVNDAFLIKVDSSGQRKWGTYFGGINDEAQSSFTLTTDVRNHVYITGNSISPDLLGTPGVHKPVRTGVIDIFLAKFNDNGNLIWNTFYGGPGTENARGIAVDADLNVYVTGVTQSTTEIATTGAYQVTSGGGQEAYLAKFNDKGQLSWATYLGGSAVDVANAVAVFDDYVVIGGGTTSTAGVATVNSYQSVKDNSQDGFLSLFKTDGSLVWSSYYGGDKVDEIKSLAMRDGFIYLLGETTSTNNMSTPGSIQENLSGSGDVFIAKFDVTGVRIWASYYGGTSGENTNSLHLSDDLRLYIGGRTNSGADVATTNAYQSTLNGGRDAYLVQINDCDAPTTPSFIAGDSMACLGTQLKLQVDNDSLVHSYHWWLPDNWSGSSDSNSIEITIGGLEGIIRVYVQSACGGIGDTQYLQVRGLPSPEPKIRNNNGILSTTQVYESYQWIRDGEAIEGATAGTYLADKNGRYSLRVSNAEGCEGLSDTVLIESVSIWEQGAPSGLSVYPNPVTTSFTLQAIASGVLELWNISGSQILHPVPVHAGLNQVDVRHLPAGMYLLRLTTPIGCFYGKLNRL